MRKQRKSLIVAMAATMALGAATLAYADGATDNVSLVTGGFTSNKQSATAFGAGTLFTQVQTYDADTQGIPDKAAERVYIDFDDDFKFDTRNIPKCTANLGASTTAQAIAACPRSVVGSGQARALVPAPSPPAPPGTIVPVELTVTAFNGPTSVAGGACTTPGDNTGGPEGCEWVGGQPTIILHAYSQAPSNVTVVKGEIQNSPYTGPGDGWGKRLAVTDAPDTANDAGALVLFNSMISKQTTKKKVIRRNGRRRVKILRFNYVAARCQDDGLAAGGKEWDFHALWVYDDNTTDEDTYAQKCSN